MRESSFLQSNYDNSNCNNHKKINGSNDFNSYGDIHRKIDIGGDKILLKSRDIKSFSDKSVYFFYF